MPRPKTTLAVVLLAALVLASFLVRLQAIQGSLPYPQSFDEPQVSGAALRILQSGDLDPHDFEYPTVPIYLTAAAFAVGFLQRCASSPCRVDTIGSVGFPYYQERSLIRAARVLFAVLSTMTLVLVGFVAYRATDESAALVLAPLVLCQSSLYLSLSWKYLNVDIVGCFFVMAAIASLFHRRERAGLFEHSIRPGALCGLAVGSKYNLFSVIFPCVLTIAFRAAPRDRLRRIGMLLVTACGAFLIGVPYALLDVPAFLNGTGMAVHHYASGHPGFNAPPGWPQLSYYLGRLVGDFGWVLILFAPVGAFALCRENWKRCAVLLAFPVSHLLYMSQQRVHFTRNVVSVYPFVAVFIAYGLSASAAFLSRLLAQSRRFRGPRARSYAAAALLALVVVPSLPWSRLVQAYLIKPDSRNAASRWVEHNVPPGSTILVARELSMNTAKMRRMYSVVELPFRPIAPEEVDVPPDAVWLIPRFDSRDPLRKPIAEKLGDRFNEERFEVLQRFGSTGVLLDYPETVPVGNPLIEIARRRVAPAPGAGFP